jgi:hypothetical protein
MRNIFIIIVLFYQASVTANVPPAYSMIAKEYGLPDKLLYAVALVESEHPALKKPWPWTANIRGKAFYFDTRLEMYNHLAKVKKQTSKFDAGIMQTNWRWHQERFDSLWDATDPYKNIRAGAAYLSELYRSSGSYDVAVGRYHSNDPLLAAAYRGRVKQRLRLVLAGKR